MDGLRLTAISVISVCGLLGPTSGQAPVAPDVQFDARRAGPTLLNLGLACTTGGPELGGDFMLLEVWEGGQGQDLNGDGDILDLVMHSVSLSTGAATNLGLAVSGTGNDLDQGGELGSLSVSEVSQGADLNGDGDLKDWVGFAVDPPTGTTVNLGLASAVYDTGILGIFVPYGLPSDGRFLFSRVSEKDQGLADLNGDGDTLDHVYHVYDSVTGIVTNSTLAIGQEVVPSLALGQGVVGVGLGEIAMSTDLNADGDVADVVGALIDANTFTGVNLALAGRFQGSSPSTGYAIFLVSEQDHAGVDMTGDGDVQDDIIHVVDTVSRSAFSLGWSCFGTPVMAAQAVAFKVPEDDYPGPDLNGDGDYSDLVAFTYHFPSATLFASGLAVDSIDGTQATFLCNVSEQKQGHTDLNGDGDPDDHVGHVLDALQGRSANLGLSASAIDVAGDFAIFNVYEFGQGAVDLNGDGDVLDSVLHLHVIPTQDSWDSGVSCDQQIFKSKVVGSSAVWLADEADEGFTDLNGDGDQGDLVLHALRPGGSTPLNLGLAAHSIYPPHPAKAAFVSADEADQHQDLNGDGDQVDLVAHLLLP